jgi:hypothetical protein
MSVKHSKRKNQIPILRRLLDLLSGDPIASPAEIAREVAEHGG